MEIVCINECINFSRIDLRVGTLSRAAAGLTECRPGISIDSGRLEREWGVR